MECCGILELYDTYFVEIIQGPVDRIAHITNHARHSCLPRKISESINSGSSVNKRQTYEHILIPLFTLDKKNDSVPVESFCNRDTRILPHSLQNFGPWEILR